jgi:hypothetical protein
MHNLPRVLVRLADRCLDLPTLDSEDMTAGPVIERLYFKMAEAKLEVQELRDQTQEQLQEQERKIEAESQRSTEPWWATEDDHDAGSPRFESYLRDVAEAETEIKAKVQEMKPWRDRLRVQLAIIDEFLAKAAEKTFPGGPKDHLGRRPGDPLPTTRELRDHTERVDAFLGSE